MLLKEVYPNLIFLKNFLDKYENYGIISFG